MDQLLFSDCATLREKGNFFVIGFFYSGCWYAMAAYFLMCFKERAYARRALRVANQNFILANLLAQMLDKLLQVATPSCPEVD